MTTPVWFTGFNYGLFQPATNGAGLADAVVGIPTIVSTTKRRPDGYALRAYATGTPTSVYFAKNPTSGATSRVASVYYWCDVLPSVSTQIVQLSVVAGNIPAIWLLSDGTVEARIGTVSGQAWTLGTLSSGTLYRFDMRAYVGGVTGTFEWYVNGVEQPTYSRTGTATTFASVRLGMYTASTGDMYFTDVIVSDTSTDYPIGAEAVQGLRPNQDGTHNSGVNIMEDSAGNDIDGATYFAYDKLNENPWVSGSASNYVRQTANGAGNYCEIQFQDATGTSFLGVLGLLQYASATTSANNGGCIIRRSDNTEITLWGVSGSLADYSEASAFYKYVMVAPPGGGWTQTEVNALRCRFGYSTDANPDPYWLAIMLEAAYVISEGTTLVVAESSHNHAAESPGLTSTYNLSADGSGHFHSAQEVTLVQTYALVAQESSHSHTAENAQISQASSLIVQESSHSHVGDAASLTQTYVLDVQQSSHAHSGETATLTQIYILSVQESLHSHSGENVTLVQVYAVVVQESSHNHSSENALLTQTYSLVAQESLHSHLADNVTISTGGADRARVTWIEFQIPVSVTAAIVPSSTLHAHAADNVTFTHIYNLSVQESLHSHTAESVTLVQTYSLAVDETVHAHLADNVVLSSAAFLDVQSALHSHTAENVSLTQIYSLSTVECLHGHLAEEPALTQVYTLIPQECIHAHSAENVTISSEGELIVQSGLHAHAADNVTLVQIYTASVNETRHLHTADNVTITQVYTLAANETLHSHTADNVTFSVLATLYVNETTHSHLADNVTLVVAVSNLSVSECLHAHFADSTTIIYASMSDGVATGVVTVMHLAVGRVTERSAADVLVTTHSAIGTVTERDGTIVSVNSAAGVKADVF